MPKNPTITRVQEGVVDWEEIGKQIGGHSRADFNAAPKKAIEAVLKWAQNQEKLRGENGDQE